MVRVMRAFPELVTLVRGIFRATRSVLSTLLLMIVILYVFAIVFTMQMRHIRPDEYGSMARSMLSLFVFGTLLDEVSGELVGLRDTDLMVLFLFVFYILISNFTIL